MTRAWTKWTAYAVMGAVLALGLIGSPALAKVFTGTGKANRVVGTKKADRISLKGGNDRARGRGGNDRISGDKGNDRLSGDAGKDTLKGGAGKDRLTGGKGRDRLLGGSGNDVLNAVDKAKDAKVDGGSGRNTCRIDALDLKVVSHCFKIKVAATPGSGGNTGSGGGNSGGGSGSSTLALASASGVTCGSTLPTCRFSLAGRGADAPVGTVTGEGGAQLAAGAGVFIQGDAWNAEGLYGCTGNGALVVRIGSKSVRVPVTCTTSG